MEEIGRTGTITADVQNALVENPSEVLRCSEFESAASSF